MNERLRSAMSEAMAHTGMLEMVAEAHGQSMQVVSGSGSLSRCGFPWADGCSVLKFCGWAVDLQCLVLDRQCRKKKEKKRAVDL